MSDFNFELILIILLIATNLSWIITFLVRDLKCYATLNYDDELDDLYLSISDKEWMKIKKAKTRSWISLKFRRV